jgi:hypothetical protein
MATFRKALPQLAFWLLVAILAVTDQHRRPIKSVFAQANNTPYDTLFSETLTSATIGTPQQNSFSGGQSMSRSFAVEYYTDGFSAVSLQFETCLRNADGTLGTCAAVPNTLCSGTVQPPCVLDGSNPITATGSGTFAVSSYAPWFRVNVTSATGSGHVKYRIYGYHEIFSASGAGSPSFNGFQHYRQITINPNSNLVPSTQAPFQVLFSGTYSYLALVGSGGNVQHPTTLNGQTVPADVVFTSDAGCTTPLQWEVASYTGTSGAIEAWINITSLGTGPTVIYLCYNNASVSTYQGSAASVWPATATGIYHLPNGTTLAANNSVSSPLPNGTISNATATAGPYVGGAGRFNGTNAQITMGNPNLSSYTGLTASAWWNCTALTGVAWGQWAATFDGESFYIDPLGGSGHVNTSIGTSSNNAYTLNGSSNTCDSAWHLVTITWSSGTSTFSLYVDAALQASNASIVGTNLNNGSANGTLIMGNYTGFSAFFTGAITETEIWNVAQSADWITTTFNNQSSPSTFYTIGSEH